MIVVLTSTSLAEEAESLANGLVESRVAACVQILSKVTSVYLWKGRIEKGSEHLLLIKTLPEKYEAVERHILDNHSYETPELIALNVELASAKYREWVDSVFAESQEIN